MATWAKNSCSSGPSARRWVARAQARGSAALSYVGFRLERGQRYSIDFRAWASAPTLLRATLGMASSPYREHWVRYFELGRQPRQWRTSIVMSDPYEPTHQLAFQGGGPAARTSPVTFCIDDVRLSAW
jgi:hypothetical protein